MQVKSNVEINGVSETLLISLNARCFESIHPKSVMKDPKSIEIAEGLGYDFRNTKSDELTNIGTGIRTVVFNQYTEEFLSRNPDGVVVNLACGLDTRFHRLDNGTVEWYDLDFPEIIEIRKRFFSETERYHFIPKSVLDFTWLEQVPKGKPILLTAEGLSCYLTELEMKKILTNVAKAFPKAEFAIEAISPMMVKHRDKHRAMKGYNADFKWGVESGKELDKWNTGFHFVDECFFMSLPECKRRSWKVRLLCILPQFAKSTKIFRLRNY